MDSVKGEDPASVDLMLLSSAKKLAQDSPTRHALSESIGNEELRPRGAAGKKLQVAQTRGMVGRKRTLRGDLVQHARGENRYLPAKPNQQPRLNNGGRRRAEIGERRMAAPSKIAALFSPSVRGRNRAPNLPKKSVLGDTTSQNARLLEPIPEAEPAGGRDEDENKVVVVVDDENVEEGGNEDGKEKGLPDIDCRDLDNPLFCGHYVVDIYKWYKVYEQDLLVKSNFLDVQAQINAAMRHVVVDWMLETHSAMRLRPETLFLSITYMDRFLAKVQISKRNFHLLAGTCIYLAAKYEEMQAPNTRDIAESMEAKYTSADILSMEKELFTALDGWCCAPTVAIFLRRYVRAVGYDRCAEAVAYCDYLSELSLYEYDLVHLPPSQISAAIVLIARHSFGDAPIYPEELRAHSECIFEDIHPIAKKLVSILRKLPVEPKRKGAGRYVWDKYSSSKKHKVAHRSVPDI